MCVSVHAYAIRNQELAVERDRYGSSAAGLRSSSHEDGTESTRVWLVGSHFTNSLIKGGSTRGKPTCCTEEAKERREEWGFFFLFTF